MWNERVNKLRMKTHFKCSKASTYHCRLYHFWIVPINIFNLNFNWYCFSAIWFFSFLCKNFSTFFIKNLNFGINLFNKIIVWKSINFCAIYLIFNNFRDGFSFTIFCKKLWRWKRSHIWFIWYITVFYWPYLF